MYVQVTEWAHWLPLNYILESSQFHLLLPRTRISHLHAKCASNGSCCFFEISTSICLPRCTLTTVHQYFLYFVGHCYRATHRVFRKKMFQFASVCLERSWVAWGRYNYGKLTCGSRVLELPNAAKLLSTVALQKRRERSPKIDVKCLITAMFRHYI